MTYAATVFSPTLTLFEGLQEANAKMSKVIFRTYMQTRQAVSLGHVHWRAASATAFLTILVCVLVQVE
jgi:hypothetical protein